jgi:two-component system, OmpR family, response regulator
MPSRPNSRVSPWSNRVVAIFGAKPRVLIVDDNKNAAAALAALLTIDDMECRTAYGGDDAIRIATDWLPHLIIMDISMPSCTGYDATRVLRAQRKTHSTAIIAFTAPDEDEVRRNLRDHEFDGYCQKGQPPALLVELIKRFAH